MDGYEVTDFEWRLIQPLLPNKPRGVFKSVADLQDAIRRYIREHNRTSRPFVWTKPAETILAKINRLHVPSK